MTRKLLDGILLLAALVGFALVWQEGRSQDRLRARYEQLTRGTGDFSIIDPSRIHVLALDTGEPMHFAWRVYLPANYELIPRGRGSGVVSASPPSECPSRELILRVRFREDAGGRLNLYQVNEGSSSRGAFGHQSLSKVLHGRFDKVLVEQLGTPNLVSVGADEPLNLLRLKLPADMDAEMIREMSPSERASYNSEFFELSFGPEPKRPPTIGAGT